MRQKKEVGLATEKKLARSLETSVPEGTEEIGGFNGRI